MLLVFSDDWNRHPSSCQHLVRRLLPEREVLWVNTIGMRPPRLDYATLRRGIEKIAEWSPRPTERAPAVEENLRVLRPLMWPWFRRTHDRWLNERLLMRALNLVLRNTRGPVQALTTVPIVADLIGRLPIARWSYYCVDDFSCWPGLDQPTMLQMEQELLAKCDDVIAVSENLVDRLRSLGRTAGLLTHGVDLDFWQSGDNAQCLPCFPKDNQPLIVFWGVVDRRMNVDWIEHLARRLSGGKIALVGPLDRPEERLLKIPGVICPGPLPMSQLPGLARAAAVLIMPYADLPVTRAMQPLKLKEYLATGRPIVVSNLPSTAVWSDGLDIASSATQFTDYVLNRLKTGTLPSQLLARERLQRESWDAKAEQFAAWLANAPSVSGVTHNAALAAGVSV